MTTPPGTLGNLGTAAAAFSGLVDLAAENLGGKALAASDEFFAGKENLLKPGRGVFIAEKFTDRGKWMDGWESRRRRQPGHDWCVIRLGVPGEIRGIDVDTNHFLGNYPAEASLEACSHPTGDDTDNWHWQPLIPRSPLRPGSQNLLAVTGTQPPFSHVRLNIFPDGGVARLRIWGVPHPEIPRGEIVDLANLCLGAEATACSDMFFARPENLLRPTPPVNMGDGWETRRRRGPGHDWAVIRLAAPGTLDRIEIDTSFFIGNYPDRFSLDICRSDQRLGALDCQDAPWRNLLPETPLEPDQSHLFAALPSHGPISHVRLNIFPDGGVARLRLWGVATAETDQS